MYEGIPQGEPTTVIKPTLGSALLFGGDLTHAGMQVQAGLRSVFVCSFSTRTPASREDRVVGLQGGSAAASSTLRERNEVARQHAEANGGGGSRGAGTVRRSAERALIERVMTDGPAAPWTAVPAAPSAAVPLTAEVTSAAQPATDKAVELLALKQKVAELAARNAALKESLYQQE